MKKMLLVCLFASSFIGANSWACSAFSLENSADAISAKSYDYDDTHGFMFVNQKGKKKTAMLATIKTLTRAQKWTSKYGSVSFTQSNQDVSFSGMNEHGLMVELLVLEETRYPEFDKSKKYIGEAQVGQYLLDNATTLDEAVDLLKGVGVTKLSVNIHYFVCDSKKDCGVLEFVNGKLDVHKGEQFPVKAITNNRYGDSMKMASIIKVEDLRNYDKLDMDGRSYARFALAMKASKGYNPSMDPIEYAFKSLDSLRVDNPSTKYPEKEEVSQWNIVYNQTEKKIYFRSKTFPKIKEIDLKQLDFNCSKDTKYFDMDQDVQGDVFPLLKTIKFKDRARLLKAFPRTSLFVKGAALFIPPMAKCEK